MDFFTWLPISTNWKGKTYDSILVIINRLTKIVSKVIIDALALVKIIIKMVIQHHGLSNSIVSD